MRTFNELWQLLSPEAKYANRRRACYELWNTLSEAQQNALYETISGKLSKGIFVDYNPLFAMMNNNQQPTVRQTMSFAEYYAKFRTTEEMDGWKMENPTGRQVIYVKADMARGDTGQSRELDQRMSV